MTTRVLSVLFAALLAALGGIGVTPAAAAPTCASLASLALQDTTITAAQPIPAGTYTAPMVKSLTICRRFAGSRQL
jgi:hypothetical protein